MTLEDRQKLIEDLVFQIAREKGLGIRGCSWHLTEFHQYQGSPYTGPSGAVNRLCLLDAESQQSYIGFTDLELEDVNQRPTVESRIREALQKLQVGGEALGKVGE